MSWRRIVKGAQEYVQRGELNLDVLLAWPPMHHACRVAVAQAPAHRHTCIAVFFCAVISCAVKNPFPPAEKHLYSFSTPADLELWSLYSDRALGGSSTAGLQPSKTDQVY